MTKQNEKRKEDEQIIEEKKPEDKKVQQLKQRIQELEDKYKRALADYQNLEKRVRDDKANWIKLANRDLLLRVLPVLDTLMLASMHSKDPSLNISMQQFLDILKSEGVEKIKTQGENFDPHIMECIEIVEGEENKVMDEVRAGFKLHDLVLRPAQVKVGSAKQNDSARKNPEEKN